MFEQPVSPTTAASPSSHGMVRKRTLQDAAPPPLSPSTAFAPSPATSSSPAAHAFQFDSSPRASGSLLSSPASVYSSPMARSASAQSSFSPFSPYSGANTSPLGKADPDYDPDATVRRPNIKRRRTLAEAGLPRSPVKSKAESRSPEQPLPARGFGKDGVDVWPTDCEEAFHTALLLLPRLGRKKLVIEGKPKGRNELIGDYIFRVTGKERTRKQVSSHIQVLKSQLKDDHEFMELVSEPIEGDDRFTADNAVRFFGAGSPYARLGAFAAPAFKPKIDIPVGPQLAPPAAHGNVPVALHSPFVMHPAHSVATPTTQLANAFEDMSVLPAPVPPACPIVPAELCIWVAPSETSSREDGHVFAHLRDASEPQGKVFVEDLPLGVERYPMLPDMIDRQPCQFLHVKLNFDTLKVNGSSGLDDKISTHLSVHSLQELKLHVVTTIYIHGDEAHQYIDRVAQPRVLGVYGESPSTSARAGSPLARSFRHKFAYDVPFAADYWTSFLSTADEPQRKASPARRASKTSPFARAGEARFDLADNLRLCSVVQEFVVVDERLPAPQLASGAWHRGNDLGDVVLVVAYDFDASEGARKGTAALSYLSTRRSSAPPRVAAGAGSAAYTRFPCSPLAPPVAPPMLRSATSPARMAFPPAPASHDSMPPPARPMARLPSTHAVPRPQQPPANLSLHIPSPTQFLRCDAPTLGHLPPLPSAAPLGSAALSGPTTPWGQIAHTPGAPPPLVVPSAEEDAQQRERLQQLWLQCEALSPMFLETGAGSAPPLEGDLGMLPTAGLAPPLDLDGMFDACVAPSAYEDFALPELSGLGLPAGSQALNALTASAAALPTPSFTTFAAADPALHHLDGYGLPAEAAETPQLSPSNSMSLCSSTGSSASLQSTEGVLAPSATVPRRGAGGDPAKGAPKDKARARKVEQDYFSSLLGPTKYTGVYS
ncbi:hypothetical protein JCM10450v2_002011 [Rhodotorula kratochvilovae]